MMLNPKKIKDIKNKLFKKILNIYKWYFLNITNILI